MLSFNWQGVNRRDDRAVTTRCVRRGRAVASHSAQWARRGSAKKFDLGRKTRYFSGVVTASWENLDRRVRAVSPPSWCDSPFRQAESTDELFTVLYTHSYSFIHPHVLSITFGTANILSISSYSLISHIHFVTLNLSVVSSIAHDLLPDLIYRAFW